MKDCHPEGPVFAEGSAFLWLVDIATKSRSLTRNTKASAKHEARGGFGMTIFVESSWRVPILRYADQAGYTLPGLYRTLAAIMAEACLR